MLLLRAAVQRREVAREFEGLEARLRLTDHYLAVGRRIVLHPLVIAVLGRGRAFQLLGRALLLTRGIRGLLQSARGRI